MATQELMIDYSLRGLGHGGPYHAISLAYETRSLVK